MAMLVYSLFVYDIWQPFFSVFRQYDCLHYISFGFVTDPLSFGVVLSPLSYIYEYLSVRNRYKMRHLKQSLLGTEKPLSVLISPSYTVINILLTYHCITFTFLIHSLFCIKLPTFYVPIHVLATFSGCAQRIEYTTRLKTKWQ